MAVGFEFDGVAGIIKFLGTDILNGLLRGVDKNVANGVVGIESDSTVELLDDLVFPKTSGVGIKVDTTTPTYPWFDLFADVYPKTTGAGSPVLTTFNANIRFFAYTAGDDGEVNFHIPHDYVPGSDVYFHIHWAHNGTAISGQLETQMDAIYAKGHNQANFGIPVTTKINVSTPDVATVPQYRHRIDEIQLSASGGLINPAAPNITINASSSTLTAASAFFSANDVNKSVTIIGAGPAGGNLETVISAFTSSTQVTLLNSASTTVTTQPNFRWRVIDSSLLEPDGVLCIHYDVNTIPTITGGSNRVFIMFVDLHYQSTGIGTKQKAPNFYV